MALGLLCAVNNVCPLAVTYRRTSLRPYVPTDLRPYVPPSSHLFLPCPVGLPGWPISLSFVFSPRLRMFTRSAPDGFPHGSVFALHETFGRGISAGTPPPLPLSTLGILRSLTGSASNEVRLHIAASIGKIGPTLTDPAWVKVRTCGGLEHVFRYGS